MGIKLFVPYASYLTDPMLRSCWLIPQPTFIHIDDMINVMNSNKSGTFVYYNSKMLTTNAK